MILFQVLKFISLTLFYLGGYWLTTLGNGLDEKTAKQAEWLYRYLIGMGPVYIKIGQILATRSDLIPDSWVEKLRGLQDDVPGMDEATTRRIINRELNQPLEHIFSEFSFQPLASASIAQVHAATLVSGQKVAVKIVKKNVRKQLEQNLKIILFLVSALHKLSPGVRELALPERWGELSRLLLVQTDMRWEAKQQDTIYINFKGHPYIIVPAVWQNLCTSSILIAEFVEAIPGKNFSQVDFPLPHLAQRLQDSIYTMLYLHGVCHGDPHPGNIFFTKDGKIILLDFGITVELSEDEKWGLSSFYYACIRKEWQIAVERFTNYFVAGKEKLLPNWSKYVGEMQQLLQYHFDIRTARWSTISYFQDVNKVLNKYGARYTSNFTKVELVFLSCEGFVSQIDRDIDIWANARKFTDRYSPYMNERVKAKFDDYFQKVAPNSLKLRDNADGFMVAPTHIHRYFFPSTYPIFVKKASQGRLEDVDGNVYVDLSCGYGPHILGYAHPAITEAIAQAAVNGGVNAIGNEAELQLAKLIVEAFPAAEKAILCNSGTEAVLQAIRLCRGYRKRDRVAKFEGHYHGFSDQGMVSSWFRFTGSKLNPQPMAGTKGSDSATVENTLVLQYGYLEGLERLREQASELACAICEPMPTAMASYDLEFLQALRTTCTELDIPLIFDEVVSGFRVTYGGMQVLASVKPDLTCLGKVIGGGLPCGGVAGREYLINIAKSSQDPFYDYENKVFVGGTLSGNSMTCTAGVAALNHLKDRPEIYGKLAEQTDWLAERFRDIASQYEIPLQMKAWRSIFSLTFSHRPTKFYREKQAGSNFKANLALAYYMRKYGVYMPELHTLMLNAAHTQADLDLACYAFDRSLQDMLEDNFFVV